MSANMNPRMNEEAAALGPWFHNLHLPDGTQTAPEHFLGDFPSFKWSSVERAVPPNLQGWSALDIGCNAGFYSFELARRGAEVLGLDVDARYLRQARWAAQRLGLDRSVEFREGQVHDLIDWETQFDFVWFTGVFYHLRYPVLALDLVRRATRRLMMFQTLTMPGGIGAPAPSDMRLDERELMLAHGWPKLAFIENALEADRTNWWAPNAACVEALLRTAGFRVLARPEHEFWLCEPAAVPETPELDRLRTLMGGRS
jgi:tRNA (mo5U34)-methyltransferase